MPQRQFHGRRVLAQPVLPSHPGHEIAGVINAVGPDVVGWDTGQRVGVGWFEGIAGITSRTGLVG